jgi:hypothetical protein
MTIHFGFLLAGIASAFFTRASSSSVESLLIAATVFVSRATPRRANVAQRGFLRRCKLREMRSNPHKYPTARGLHGSRRRPERRMEWVVAYKNVAVAGLGGGALLLGYAGFSWLRAKRAARTPGDHFAVRGARRQDVAPLSERLEHLPEESALGFEADTDLAANSNAFAHRIELGGLFFARATDALSPFHWPDDHIPETKRVPR